MKAAPACAAFTLVLVAGAFAGCAPQRQWWTAERVVRAYNEALSEAYRMSDATRLLPVAGRREVGRVQVLIDLKRAAHLVLESRLESFAVTGVRADGPDSLRVRTRERWRYHDRATRPGQPLGRVFVADMEMEWQLARAEGTWKVDRGRTLSSTYVEPQDLVTARGASHGESQEAEP